MTDGFWHPLVLIPDGGWRYLALGLFVAVGLTATRFMSAHNPKHGPRVLALELAGTAPAVEAVFNQWDADDKNHARHAIWYDFLFIVGYGLTTAMGCAMVARSEYATGFFDPRIGTALVWVTFAAMLCDAVENAAMLGMLGTPDAATFGPLPRVAQVFAITKFVLLFAAWYYCAGVLLLLLLASLGLTDLIRRLVRRVRGRRVA